MRHCPYILLVFAVLGCQPTSAPVAPSPPPPSAPPAEQEVQEDGPIPAITLEDVDKEGFEKALASKRGKIVLIDAWATWCPPCKADFPHTVALHEKYSPQGLAVISLSMDDDDAHEEALVFLTERQARFTNLRSKLGADEAAFEQFDIDGGSLPHLKLYDRDGKLVKKFVTGDPEAVFTPEEVELAVRELITRSAGY
jgi:thiol-disulfide isomerase/thioredoxin